MQTNFSRGLQTDHDASGHLGGDSLDVPDLFEDEGGDVSYSGAAGAHNSEGLDLMPFPWAAPASGPSKEHSPQRNARNAGAQSSGDWEDDLDVLEMKW